MPDLRYHLISLIAVFLALAIGVLLGVALSDRGVVSSGLEAQITDVQRRLELQQEEIANRDRQISRLRDRATRDEELMSAMAENLVSDSLIGVEVAVVSGPYSDDETVQSALDALDAAGATVTTSVSLDEPQLADVTTAETTTVLQTDYATVAQNVLQETGGGDVPPQVVVFVGGGEIPPDSPEETLDALSEAQADMFDLWEQSGVRVVAAESSRDDRSDVELFQSAGIASVDNADTAAGRAALVQLISSDETGSFGTKDTASDFFPAPPN